MFDLRIGGTVFGNTTRHPCTFLIFGAALLPKGLEHVTPMTALYAVLSLTLRRMLPIAVSLVERICMRRRCCSSAGSARAVSHRSCSCCSSRRSPTARTSSGG